MRGFEHDEMKDFPVVRTIHGFPLGWLDDMA